MARPIRVWDALGVTAGVGFKAPVARLALYNEDASVSMAGATGWRLINAAWWFEHSQLTDDPPTFHDEWHYLFDYTVPTAAPLSPGCDFYPLDDLTYPKSAVATWVGQSRPYPVGVDFYRSTDGGSFYFLQESGVGFDSSPSVMSSAAYNAGDRGYVIVYYTSIDGNVAGPASSSGVRIF